MRFIKYAVLAVLAFVAVLAVLAFVAVPARAEVVSRFEVPIASAIINSCGLRGQPSGDLPGERQEVGRRPGRELGL
ncbi:MAG: hypothetical protein QG615_1759 [Nitrospirota bacterium]|nr:hypothetical protein [Nitrospirota bacterium]